MNTPTNKTLIFDTKSQAFQLHSSLPVPIPNPAKGDHLIRVMTTALCKGELDWPTLFPDVIFSENPEGLIVPGYDVAGTVISAPPASRFRPGDEIIGRTRPSRQGNCREYSIARSEEMALKPPNLSWAEAAAVPVSALTAWQALFEHAEVQGFHDPKSPLTKVLVTAAAGSVGIWLVQLAKMAGLDVVAQVGNLENDKLVRELGAADVVNYKTTSLKDWADTSGPVDVVFDLQGGETLEDAWYCVKDNGTLISIVDAPGKWQPEQLKGKTVKNEFFIVADNSHQLSEISNLASEGRLLMMVDSVWNLDDYEGAFAKLDAGHARGKVVIKAAG
ncbi:MAG: hypothetical protein LQ338_008298 [Usnochroma carphineum]|nr:MAG: hypothetical protein LQ338_008298 [Usnochroma carphineum]